MPIDVNCSAWKGFRTGEWRHLVNVRNFIQKNYTPYAGDESFLAPTSERTRKVWDKSHALILEELRKGILDVETDAISGINNFAPGYIDRDNEVIVGLQTDAPLKRIVNLYGGMRMAESALEQYGYTLNPEIESISEPTARPTMTACSTPIPTAPGWPAPWACSPACPTLTAVAASWVTTAASPCTALIF